MRTTYLFIVTTFLLASACKKETKETIAGQPPVSVNAGDCFGNTWSAVPVYTFPFPKAVAYNNKSYFFFNLTGQDGSVAIFDGANWEVKASDIPITTVLGSTNLTFVIGDKAYLGLIAYPQFTHRLFEYDFANNTWEQKANFPGPERSSHTSFVIGNKAYIVGGISSYPYQHYNDTWEYNQATDSWSQKSNYPGFLSKGGMTGFNIGSKGYVVNGVTVLGYPYADILHNNLLEYNQPTDSWSTKATFPGLARSNAISFTISGIPYVGGGQNNDGRLVDFYKYNQGSNSWTRVADIIGTGQIYTGFSINSKGYALRYDNDQIKLFKYSPLVCFSSPTSLVN